MATLLRDLRRQLENAVAEARRIAEEGAEQSLHRLAVDVSRPHDALNNDEKKLRVSLRAHAKQLGDRQDQRPAHLIQAVAYEHWHRLLFARFLIENNLLLHPEHGVALSLDEVKESALDQKREWVEVAADYAQHMLLRKVFQPDDPALRVSLAPEKRFQLEEKLNSLPREVFLADDSLGWVYQLWQRDEKARINASEIRIGPDELPAVTQLFTEDYMVLYLLENTLGAWWTAKRRSEGHDPRLPGYDWTYLRLNEDGSPAAGPFNTWPRATRELRVLDPCMGSGHFLVFALPILARMRMAEEGLSLTDATAAVLRDNLFGLEIDARCAQIAAFNLGLAAWRLAGKHFSLPDMNLACSGLGINAPEADWVRLASGDQSARGAMQKLYALFQQAPLLGSLIEPSSLGKDLFVAEYKEVWSLLEMALAAEQQNDEAKELAIAAKGLLVAQRILAGTFNLVITNVPYLLKAKQREDLQTYCKRYAPDAAADLATVFVERCAHFCKSGGTHATVTPQNWLFLKSYAGFRRRLLTQQRVCHVATVGSGATATASWDVLRALVISTTGVSAPEYEITGVETNAAKEEQRALDLRTNVVLSAKVSGILQTSTCRLALAADRSGTKLLTYADSLQGLSTGDNPRFEGCFWEFQDFNDIWAFEQGVVRQTMDYGGREGVVRWDRGEGALAESEGSAIRGLQAQGKGGVVISRMRSLPATLFSGSFFDINVAVILPKNQDDLAAIWAYCSSQEFCSSVRQLDKKLNVTNATMGEVVFDLEHWREVARTNFPTGLPKPNSSDPTQWLFSGYPKDADYPLQVAVARLVGYRWPRQTGSSFPDCPALGRDGLESHADCDGIVTLSSLAGKASAADRLRALLADAYGAEWSATILAGLVGDCETLDIWLRDQFFEEHCQIYHQRPFIWHIWDGRKDGFHALVNYHLLDHKLLEKLIYSTLGDWISRQRQDVPNGIEGADGRLAAAVHLQGELINILDGEAPYDICVRWKPLREQPIGWGPDLNDGVRVNIRPWITAAKLYRTTKPGILRFIPNIKYGKDRGKESARYLEACPWFDNSRDRINDIHLTLEDKRKARGRS